LFADGHRLWSAVYFSDNKDGITADFRGFAISHEKQVVSDLLQYAKAVMRREDEVR
jgi:hypothetical protein